MKNFDGKKFHFNALSNEYIIKLYSTTCVTRYQVDTLWIYGKKCSIFHAFVLALSESKWWFAFAFFRVKMLRRNLINFWNTQQEKKSWRRRKNESDKEKKSWIDWYFAIKLFIFFNHLVMWGQKRRAVKLRGKGKWTTRRKESEKDDDENWY